MYKEVPCTPHTMITSYTTKIPYQSQETDMGATHRAYSHFTVLHALVCMCMCVCVCVCVCVFMQFQSHV